MSYGPRFVWRWGIALYNDKVSDFMEEPLVVIVELAAVLLPFTLFLLFEFVVKLILATWVLFVGLGISFNLYAYPFASAAETKFSRPKCLFLIHVVQIQTLQG